MSATLRGADRPEGLILGHSAASLRAVRRFSSVARVVPAEWVGWRAHVRDRNVYLAVWCRLAHCWPHSARPSHVVCGQKICRNWVSSWYVKMLLTKQFGIQWDSYQINSAREAESLGVVLLRNI